MKTTTKVGTVRRYCACGAGIVVHSDDEASIETQLSLFNKAHSGDGHEPCDKKTAHAAWLKSEQCLRIHGLKS